MRKDVATVGIDFDREMAFREQRQFSSDAGRQQTSTQRR